MFPYFENFAHKSTEIKIKKICTLIFILSCKDRIRCSMFLRFLNNFFENVMQSRT